MGPKSGGRGAGSRAGSGPARRPRLASGDPHHVPSSSHRSTPARPGGGLLVLPRRVGWLLDVRLEVHRRRWRGRRRAVLERGGRLPPLHRSAAGLRSPPAQVDPRRAVPRPRRCARATPGRRPEVWRGGKPDPLRCRRRRRSSAPGYGAPPGAAAGGRCCRPGIAQLRRGHRAGPHDGPPRRRGGQACPPGRRRGRRPVALDVPSVDPIPVPSSSPRAPGGLGPRPAPASSCGRRSPGALLPSPSVVPLDRRSLRAGVRAARLRPPPPCCGPGAARLALGPGGARPGRRGRSRARATRGTVLTGSGGRACRWTCSGSAERRAEERTGSLTYRPRVCPDRCGSARRGALRAGSAGVDTLLGPVGAPLRGSTAPEVGSLVDSLWRVTWDGHPGTDPAEQDSERPTPTPR